MNAQRGENMITVVMPLYNAAKTIELSLNSIKGQTRLDYIKEIIVVNDGSTDQSLQIAEDYARDNKDLPIHIVNQPNSGAAAARNIGISLAQTKYIAFLDADDIWLPRKIEIQMDTIKKYPKIRFLGTGWEEKGIRIGLKKINSLYNGSVKDVCIKNFPVTPSILMEKTLFNEIGMFNPNIRYAEDINLFQKVAAKGNYFFLPEKLVQIDIGKDFFAESGQSANLKEMHKGTLRNIKELRESKDISFAFWFVMRIFYQMKYWRRIILRNLRIWGKRKASNK